MATYEDIYGKRVKDFDSDPTLTSSYEGQVWYDKSTGVLKSVVSFATWSSGPPVNTQRLNGSASGIQTAAVFAGGNAPPYSTATEEYNGTGFSGGGNMIDSRDPYSGFGTLTDTVTAGGYDGSNKAESETYNGTSWSEGNNLNTARRGQQGFGTSGDAGVCCGGYESSASTATEEYNGTSWTTVNAMPAARYSGCAVGAQTSGIQVGGDPGFLTTSFEYDGTNWSSGGAIPAGKSFLMLGGANQDAVIAFGGELSSTATSATSDNYDGTNWTAGATMVTGQKNISCGGWGTKTATFAAFGNGPSNTRINTSQEYGVSVNTITAAAWASGGALGTARYQMGGAGDLPAGLAYGGYGTSVPGNTNKTEEYNGTSWSEQNDMANPRGQCSGQHIGTQTAALAAGGTLPGSPNYGSACEEYNGSSWTAGGALTEDSGRSYLAGFGTQTAGVAGGGYAQTGATANSEHYDGSSWTAANNMNTGRYGASGTGTQTAGLAVGQYPGTGTVEEYNGTNWTSVTYYPAGRFGIYGGM